MTSIPASSPLARILAHCSTKPQRPDSAPFFVSPCLCGSPISSIDRGSAVAEGTMRKPKEPRMPRMARMTGSRNIRGIRVIRGSTADIGFVRQDSPRRHEATKTSGLEMLREQGKVMVDECGCCRPLPGRYLEAGDPAGGEEFFARRSPRTHAPEALSARLGPGR